MKINILYPFHFDGVRRKSAIKRLRTSIASIISQSVTVCVSNTSKKCIWNDIKDLGPIRYIHKHSHLQYCKGLTINFGVKQLVGTAYFLLSDIDLVYHPQYVNTMFKYLNPCPKRVVPHNYNLQNRSFYSSNYGDYNKLIQNQVKDPYRTFYGIAPGNGLVHTQTFYLIHGFNEKLIGYNIEDAEFNERCVYINNYIEDAHPHLRTVHLLHSMCADSFVNTGYLNWLRKLLKDKVGKFDFWGGPNNGEKQQKLFWLQANKGKTWGVIG